jgi:hypothetical protein
MVGIEKFPLLRPWSRSNAVTRSSNSAFALLSFSIAAAARRSPQQATRATHTPA